MKAERATMMKKENRGSETLTELLVGIIFFTLISWLVGVWFVDSAFKYTIGLWIGAALACVSAIHMQFSLQRNFDRNAGDEKAVQGTAIRSNMLRYLLVIVVFALLCVTDFSYPLAAFLGIMGLKAGAYLQPFTHRVLKRRR